MQISSFIRIAAAAGASAILCAGSVASAGGAGQFYPATRILTNGSFFDRPDLLNFVPFHPDGSSGFTTNYYFIASSNSYMTEFKSYSYYVDECFNDPDDKKMLVDNVLCVRAGHDKVTLPDLYYISYYDYPYYSYNNIANRAYANYDSEIYFSGYFRAMTDNGGEVGGRFYADIPDKLRRTKKKIKFTQSAWVAVSAYANAYDGESQIGGSGFDWGAFQGCELTGSAKGNAFMDGKSNVFPVPMVKDGELTKGKSKLSCDKDATSLMTSKIADNAEGDSSAVQAVWETALKKLGSKNKLQLKLNKKGTENID
jgi:hypothetical protein